MSDALCPQCGQPLDYHDDPDQDTWAHVAGVYVCPNGHTFSEDEIEGDGYDADDDDFYDGLDDESEDYDSIHPLDWEGI